jgi:hypothetical protein
MAPGDRFPIMQYLASNLVPGALQGHLLNTAVLPIRISIGHKLNATQSGSAHKPTARPIWGYCVTPLPQDT